MVQVLPYVPSFGEKLASSFGQAIGDIGQGYIEGKQKQRDDQSLNEIVSNPNLTPMQQIQAFSKLSPRSQQTLTPLFNTLLQTQGRAQVEQGKIASKKEEKQLAQEEDRKGLEEGLDFITKNIGYTGNQYIPFTQSWTGGGVNREAVQMREEIDATGFLAADKVFTHFNKGVISKDKLRVIQEDLAPNSKLSERKNLARVAALRRMANLPPDISQEKFNKELAKEKKAAKNGDLGPIPKGKSWIISPKTGNPIQVEDDKVEAAIAAGGRRA